jgi:hypothetical protein
VLLADCEVARYIQGTLGIFKDYSIELPGYIIEFQAAGVSTRRVAGSVREKGAADQ